MTSLLEEGLIKTTSIDQVVAPITTRLCHLILLCESRDGPPEQFAHLETAAAEVAKTSKNMARVASRIMVDSEDDVLRMEMSPLVESMTVAGQHVLLASQKLSIQPNLVEHREELILATQNVLLGVVKILLAEDDATVRKIVSAAHWVKDCVSKIGASENIPDLLKAFQVFSRAMLLLNRLVEEQVGDLRDPIQRESVKTSLDTLKKCISMLHTAAYTTIKHPGSEQGQAAKTYILQQVESTVTNITSTLQSNCSWAASGPSGYYVERRNSLLKMLSVSDCSSVNQHGLDILLRDLVFHCMMVAKTSRNELQPQVTQHCIRALQHWSDISQELKVEDDRHLQLRPHLHDLCAALMQQVHELDSAVVTAALCQVLDVFVTASAPLEQLVSAVSRVLDGELDLDSVQPLWRTFISHADRMVQVAGFISAFATDLKSLENVQSSRACLMRLRDGVAPVLQELGGDSVENFGALQKLLDLHHRWVDDTDQLLNALSEVINVKEFTSLAVQMMEDSSRGCETAYKCQDHQLLCDHARLFLGHMSQVVQAIRRHIDRSDDPIYRNGLLALVRQAEATAAEVAGCVSEICTEKPLDEETCSVFFDQLGVAKKHFQVLREGLDGLQHPDLLSPLREEARHPVVPPLVQPRAECKQLPQDSEEESVSSDQEEDNSDLLLQLVENIVKEDDLEDFLVHKSSGYVDKPQSFILGSKPALELPNIDLLPLLHDVVTMTKGRDVTALSVACTGLLELSSCYVQATKEAVTIIDAAESEEVESLRSELVALTPLLVQTAQEMAMNSGMSTDSIYKHSTQFSDLIRNTRKILLPAAGLWYHAIQSMFESNMPTTVKSSTQELTEVMGLCSDVVQLVTLLDSPVRPAGCDSIAALQSKLKKAQASTKKLADLASEPVHAAELEGACILWALSMQVLLNSLDKFIDTTSSANTGHLTKRHLTPKKWLTTMSENSLRLQEAARLSTLNCRDSYKVKMLQELQEEVRALTDLYLHASDDTGSVSHSGVLLLARSELLQRQLQAKMRTLSSLLGKVNAEYVTVIQNCVNLACSATTAENILAEEASSDFEDATELLLENVKSATDRVQDCLNYIRDPHERGQIRFLSDHLSFQTSDIVSRLKVMVESRAFCDALTLEFQTQCWSAKAQYLVAEISKVDGILPRIKEQVRLGLKGEKCAAPGTLMEIPDVPKEKTPPAIPEIDTRRTSEARSTSSGSQSKAVGAAAKQEAKRSERGLVFSSGPPCLTYTCLYLKQETERWDSHGNHIVQVTKEMATEILHMAQYLKRKGPIQDKETFVSSAKDIVNSTKSISQFLKAIADHCLDKHCADDLAFIVEQMQTVSSQLTIISNVNALTPGSKSSDESLVKNAQNLLRIVLQGLHAAEAACIRGLRQPEPNSDGAKAAALCFQWKKNLLIHRALQISNPETDDLGLRKTASRPAAPSLAASVHLMEGYK